MHKRCLALFVVVAAACGNNSSTSEDAGAGPSDAGPDADAASACGDLMVTGSEECDDGNAAEDDGCRSDCTFSCGDGVLGASELCDTGIAEGESGACPSDCNDNDACTSDVVSEDSCQTMCINATISAFTDGDSCCPAGGDNTLDSDCAVVCGNEVVESGESCDTAIATGVGACVVAADCDDGIACTSDDLLNAGTCTAACANPVIAGAIDDDGCCPTGGTIATDNDCPAGCGDGVVTPPETCDTAIANDCPVLADCSDGNSCTQDLLLSGGTCLAECSNPAITGVANGDGCCPPGANANNDSDCTPVCGNSVVESGEQCDDGDILTGDGCDQNCQNEIIAPAAFRVSNIRLREPHAFASFFGCWDATDEVFGIPGINPTFDDNTNEDGDGDGLLDLSIAQVFRPLDQAQASNVVEVHFPDCSDPIDTTTCTSTQAMPDLVTATNLSTGTCLTPVSGTTGPGNSGSYSPTATNATGPCYSTSPATLVIDVAGMVIILDQAQFGATYVGNPATGMTNGLLIGFLSEANANAAVIPADISLVGGDPLSSILPGGADCCRGGASSALDIGPGGVSGWWMALNYDATVVTWVD